MNFDEFYGGVCRRNKENPNAARNTTIEDYCRQAFQAGAASRDAEVSRLVEKCHDLAAQHETDSGTIESDGKEIHFLREQCDEWKSRTEFSFGVRDRLEQERNQLREQVAMLRNALSEASKACVEDWPLLRETLAATDPK